MLTLFWAIVHALRMVVYIYFFLVDAFLVKGVLLRSPSCDLFASSLLTHAAGTFQVTNSKMVAVNVAGILVVMIMMLVGIEEITMLFSSLALSQYLLF